MLQPLLFGYFKNCLYFCSEFMSLYTKATEKQGIGCA
nr:MAG TPA: hypothetical protein [Caudoviricetes sp.]